MSSLQTQSSNNPVKPPDNRRRIQRTARARRNQREVELQWRLRAGERHRRARRERVWRWSERLDRAEPYAWAAIILLMLCFGGWLLLQEWTAPRTPDFDFGGRAFPSRSRGAR